MRDWVAGLVGIALAVACDGETTTRDAPDAKATGGTGGTVSGGSGGLGASGGVAAMGGFGASGGSSGGVGGSGGLGGFPVDDPVKMGSTCDTQAECGTWLTCVGFGSDAFGGEGPGHGYCTLSCVADPGICEKLKPTNVCAPFPNGSAYCLEGCTFGPPDLPMFDPKKCHGRPDVACTPIHSASGAVTPACVPRCASDSDCGTVLQCDHRTGLCSKTAPTGQSIGEPCSVTGPETCQGNCQAVSQPDAGPVSGQCSEGCTWGAPGACGWAGPGTGPAAAACVELDAEVETNGGTSFGDSARCAALCDCNTQCKNPALVCTPWSDPAAAALYGRKGYCKAPLAGDAGVDPGLPTCP